jgi:hypothetical protein
MMMELIVSATDVVFDDATCGDRLAGKPAGRVERPRLQVPRHCSRSARMSYIVK